MNESLLRHRSVVEHSGAPGAGVGYAVLLIPGVYASGERRAAA